MDLMTIEIQINTKLIDSRQYNEGGCIWLNFVTGYVKDDLGRHCHLHIGSWGRNILIWASKHE